MAVYLKSSANISFLFLTLFFHIYEMGIFSQFIHTFQTHALKIQGNLELGKPSLASIILYIYCSNHLSRLEYKA